MAARSSPLRKLFEDTPTAQLAAMLPQNQLRLTKIHCKRPSSAHTNQHFSCTENNSFERLKLSSKSKDTT
jgi:hypothetical protein